MKRTHPQRRAAFSLLELVVCTVIISVICGLILAVVSRASESARMVQCVSNLQQIGKAIHSFLPDHNNVFPGPVAAAQRSFTAPYFATPNPSSMTPPLTRRTALIDWLAPYIGIDVTPGSAYTPLYYSPLFICPASVKSLSARGIREQDRTYYNTVIDPVHRPFGYTSKSGFTLPLRLSAIDNPATTMALVDMDAELKPGSTYAPERPSHGKLRNVLFLDGHVESLDNDKLQ